jgi:hypothetical protein
VVISSFLGWAGGRGRLAPMSQDPVQRDRGRVLFGGPDQLTGAQFFGRYLSRAFGKPCSFSNRTKAGRDRSPSLALGLPIEIEIYQKSGGLMIMADQIRINTSKT